MHIFYLLYLASYIKTVLKAHVFQDDVNPKDSVFFLVYLCSGAVPGALEAAPDQFELQLGSDGHRRRRGARAHTHTQRKS